MEQQRPTVTVTYAQSLNGSIARQRGEPLSLSCHDSLVMTHQLRAEHDAILIGVGTLIADDPRLTVRHVAGDNPRPVVLDSRLRFPLNARLLASNPIIATTAAADDQTITQLEQSGATIPRFPADDEGYVQLPALLTWLYQQGIQSLMVEGGARTITSFLAAGLVDHVIITIAPTFVSGLNVIEMLPNAPRLVNISYQQCGNDMIIKGSIKFEVE